MAGISGAGRTLVVNLIADTSKFGNNLKNAQKDVGGFRGAINKLGSMAGPALAGAAAAAGALAVAFGVDGVKAAIEEEAAVSKLGKTLSNLGLGSATKEVEDWINKTQMATGIADDKLRPAFTRLVTSTGDVQKAQDLLNVAMDVSVATGKPLETVVAALGKAADGSTGAIGKLGVGIDAAALKSMDLNQITQTLTDKFGGSAATNADTYAGKVEILKIGFDELKESFGQGFLDGLGGAEDGLGNMTQAMVDAQAAAEDVGKAIGDATEIIADAVGWYSDAKDKWDEWKISAKDDTWVSPFKSSLLDAFDPFTGLIAKISDAIDKMEMLKYWWDHRNDGGPPTQSGGNSGGGGSSWGIDFQNPTGRPGGSNQTSNNQYAGGSTPDRIDSGSRKNRSAMGLDKSGGGDTYITIQAGIGDPVAIAREVERVLRLSETRLGP